MQAGGIATGKALNKSFDKALLNEVEGLRTNGEGWGKPSVQLRTACLTPSS